MIRLIEDEQAVLCILLIELRVVFVHNVGQFDAGIKDFIIRYTSTCNEEGFHSCKNSSALAPDIESKRRYRRTTSVRIPLCKGGLRNVGAVWHL